MSDAHEDPTGAGGQAPLEAASWIFIASGMLLLLPRQWASAGMAFVIAIICRFLHRRRG